MSKIPRLTLAVLVLGFFAWSAVFGKDSRVRDFALASLVLGTVTVFAAFRRRTSA